jgi:hypothetical protein
MPIRSPETSKLAPGRRNGENLVLKVLTVGRFHKRLAVQGGAEIQPRDMDIWPGSGLCLGDKK